MITGILGTIGAGSIGGLLLAGVELYLKSRKARKAVLLIRELASFVETDYSKLTPEGKRKADETLARANRIEGYP
jgi:hypothetical protein